MKKVFIKMNTKQKKISELMIVGWLVALGLSLFGELNWNWFFAYSVIGFIIFVLFGEIQYRKGNFREIK